MLVDNFAEVTEPYTYLFENSLTNRAETIVRSEGINLENTLSGHLKAYVKNQLNNPDDEDIVAEDEPPENPTTTDMSGGGMTDNGGQGGKSHSATPVLGKTKKDKEKALKNGDLHEHLIGQ